MSDTTEFKQIVVSNDETFTCVKCGAGFCYDLVAVNMCCQCRPAYAYLTQDKWDHAVGVAIVDPRTGQELCLVRHPELLRQITPQMRATAAQIADNLYFMGACQ